MSALQQGNFCSFGVVNLDRQPVVKIIRQRGVNLVRQEVIFYASFSNSGFKRFRLKSIPKVSVEYGLIALAHNLRKYARIVLSIDNNSPQKLLFQQRINVSTEKIGFLLKNLVA